MGDADMKERVVSWFSCGAASAVATKLSNPDVIAYCEVKEEHPDNKRFLKDCEQWFGKEIIVLGNDEYERSIYNVFDRRKYIAGVAGAPCTLLLKKEVRKQFERLTDIQVFGYTVEEQGRLDRFIDANNDVNVIAPLIDQGLTKSDCLAMVQDAGIKLPEMYKYFNNNNCVGCCKAQSPGYWLLIKEIYPEMFEKMNSYEKKYNVRLLKYTKDGEEYRIRLDEIPSHIKPKDDTVDIQCGIFCEMSKSLYEAEHERD